MLTKRDIVKKISEDLGVPQQTTKDVVQMTLDAIVEALMAEGRLELRNFGVFEISVRSSRRARNPKTDQRVRVPARFAVNFKAGKEMIEHIRHLPEENPNLARRILHDRRREGGLDVDHEEWARIEADLVKPCDQRCSGISSPVNSAAVNSPADQ